MSQYSAERRTKRTHQRAVVRGTERFEADLEDLALDPRAPDLEADDDDDDESTDGIEDDTPEQADSLPQELPPHWGEFNQQD